METVILLNCPEGSLGCLSAPAGPMVQRNVVNGVELPERVIEQLKLLGLPLSWYTSGELQEAVEACAFDSNLIDDPDGVDFGDKLTLTSDEAFSLGDGFFWDSQPFSFVGLVKKSKQKSAHGFVSDDDDDKNGLNAA